MLLARSLMDYRVGHTLFWLLRAELAHLSAINPANSTTSPLFLRLALLLEAYCRGNCAHLESMIKQVEMISTLTTLSVQIRNCGNKEAANKVNILIDNIFNLSKKLRNIEKGILAKIIIMV